MYNLVLYPAENIWRDWKFHSIFATEKKVRSQQGAMPGHALLLAMDGIFHRIVNYFEQSFVRKVAVANFLTKRSLWLLCRDGRALICRRHNPQSKSGLTLYEPTPMGRTRRTTPGSVCLNFAAGCAIPCEQIGVRVLARALHRHRCPCSGMTLVDAIDVHLHHTHPIADNVSRRREIVQIWKSRKILLSLCNDWRQRTPEATRSALQTGTGTMLSDGCYARYWHCNNNNEIPDQKTGLRIRNHYEKPAVECGTNRNGLTR